MDQETAKEELDYEGDTPDWLSTEKQLMDMGIHLGSDIHYTELNQEKITTK
jgi:hypothetical protein